MRYSSTARHLPRGLRRWIQHFEASIDDAVAAFAGTLDARARVLDAGAGEGQYAHHFARQRYSGVDLAIGDSNWNYAHLDCVADLSRLPFPDATFDACLNIVTLEHLREPQAALNEMARTMRPGGRLLIAVPLEWEVHQAPHDYFRYTSHGLRYLLERAGFADLDLRPVGGLFRLLARRLLNAVQVLPPLAAAPALLVFGPAALVLPLLDPLDRDRNFTLGYICVATRR